MADVRDGRWLFNMAWPLEGERAQFNAQACSECHANRGAASSPRNDPDTPGLVVRAYDPRSGRDQTVQRQTWLAARLYRASTIRVTYAPVAFQYPDQTRAWLFKPTYDLEVAAQPERAGSAILSPRLAPPVGFPASDCAAGNGPCGYRLDQPTLVAQIGNAAAFELGLDTDGASRSRRSLATDQIAQIAAFLSEADPKFGPPGKPEAVPYGWRELGCNACHATEAGRIQGPFDMGAGLADQGGASKRVHRMWRAPSLTAIHSRKIANPLAGYLHDGRALTLEEAILWHGGDGADARDRFARLSSAARAAFISTIQSAGARR
jgi:CxxC motif-containing protein (DUF1111 family)